MHLAVNLILNEKTKHFYTTNDIFLKLGPSKMERYKRVSIAWFQWRLDHDKVDNVRPTEISKTKLSLYYYHIVSMKLVQLWKPHTGVMYMKWLCLCSLISNIWIASNSVLSTTIKELCLKRYYLPFLWQFHS